MTTHATEELCDRIADLAADYGINLTFIGDAGPAYDTPDAVLVEFGSADDSDLMALQEIAYYGPYEFGCDWDWTGPNQFFPLFGPDHNQWVAAGQPEKFRRAIPRADLPTLVGCFEQAWCEPRLGVLASFRELRRLKTIMRELRVHQDAGANLSPGLYDKFNARARAVHDALPAWIRWADR